MNFFRSLIVIAMLCVMVCARHSLAAAPPLPQAGQNLSPAIAETMAKQAIKDFYAHLVSTMKQGNDLGFDGRFKKLEPVVTSTFNLSLMMRMAMGSEWVKTTPQQKEQLVEVFSGFSVSNYASRFASFDGEEFQVKGSRFTRNGIIIETAIKPKNGDTVTLNYLMREDDEGKPRIIDVYMNGTISELASRRSEFTTIVRRSGVSALIQSLHDKAKQMGAS